MDKVDFDGHFVSISNWNILYPTKLKHRAPLQPIVRLEAQLSSQDWKDVLDSTEAIIHYFNKPKRASISAQHAADLWCSQIVPLGQNKGKKLISPQLLKRSVRSSLDRRFHGPGQRHST